QGDVGYDGPTGWGTPNGPFFLPVAVTEDAKRVAADAVLLRGAVNPKGLETDYRFEYGPTDSYGESAPVPAAAVGNGSDYVELSQAVTGLEGNKPYHYRIVATNSAGTFTGVDRVIGTTPPEAVTGEATDIAISHAVLRGQVNPEGIETTYYFEYGPSASYGAKAPVRVGDAGLDAAAVGVSVTASGLVGGQIYHFRVVAKNAAGVAYGSDGTFTTAPPAWTATDLPQPPSSGNGIEPLGVVPHNVVHPGLLEGWGCDPPRSRRTPDEDPR
ncbi:MAG TPA: hypothetical protein VFJ65_04360, partial [Solirubrobacterales bacterium]|nr:hypothetical protein [Solirubrobacterales bacterium]